MKKTKFACFSLALLILLLAACKSVDLRSQTNTSLQVGFDGSNCTPLESIVPPQEEIQVTIINSGQLGFTWLIATPPFNPSLFLSETDNIIFSKYIAAGTTEISQFESPILPARYTIYCILDNPDLSVMLQYLLVVQAND